MKITGLPLAALGLIMYLSLLAVVYGSVLHHTQGHYTAPQDDPYIHLALAEHIRHGEYGINHAESSSPSSSMLWPLLLAATGPTSLGIYSALLWNFLPALGAILILACTLDEWPPAVLGTMPRRVIAMITFILLANLVGLTLLGMEHGLQVALAIACAFGVCRVINGRTMPWWSIAAAAVAAWVRYEDFTLTLALGILLVYQRRRVAALVMALAAVVPLLAFSLFLKHLGLPALPVSVLVKSGKASVHHNAVLNGIEVIAQGLKEAITKPVHWPLLVICCGLLVLALQQPPGIRRTASLAAATAGALHLMLGHFGWWYRYEVYAVVFCALVLMRLLLERYKPSTALYLLGAVVLSSIYLRALWATPGAAAAIYGQQYQMHRFSTDYYKGNIAVNDLGEVAYRHGDGYVLDLFGLASVEAARQPNKTADWVGALAEKHDVGLVMVYPNLFGIPSSWSKIGDLCLNHAVKGLGNRCVLFYSSKPEDTLSLRRSFQAFAQTMPPQTVATPAAQ